MPQMRAGLNFQHDCAADKNLKQKKQFQQHIPKPKRNSPDELRNYYVEI